MNDVSIYRFSKNALSDSESDLSDFGGEDRSTSSTGKSSKASMSSKSAKKSA